MTKLCNIGILAHVDAGKTTTTEHMLYQSGRLRTLGRVDEGTAHTDWLEVERTRGISVRAAVTRFEWNECTINLIDTPGHIDFSSEVERALSVLDGVILVVSAVDGVQAHTETLWRALTRMHMPTIVYVNKMDRIGVELDPVLEELKTVLHPNMVPVQVSLGREANFHGVQSIFTLHEASPAVMSEAETGLDSMHAVLAECDEALLQSFVEGKRPPSSVLFEALAKQVKGAVVFPVLFGASLKGIGTRELMDAMTELLPAAADDAAAPVSGVVFKVVRDKAHGRVSYVRLFSGTLKNRDSVHNATRNLDEKVNQIRQIDGNSYKDSGIIKAGDVAAVYGMTETRIGDVLGTSGHIRDIGTLSVPLLTVQVQPQVEQDITRLAEALQELDAEDPSLSVQWLPNERELHMKVMGTIQLEVLQQIMEERFNIPIRFSKPSVIYKETPKRAGYGFVSYTMPKPCWAILRFHIEPTAPGSGLSYSCQVRNEDMLQSYQNEVARRVPEALEQGLYGWQVTDLHITLVEGQHHVWHTHPLDFVVATPMGIMDGLRNTGVYLLEPILQFRVSAGEEYGGKILSDLSQLRAEFDNPVMRSGRFHVEGTIPLATSLDYAVQLGMMTGGRGVFASRFLEYGKCPEDVEASRTRKGVNPLDTARYILSVRSALSSQ